MIKLKSYVEYFDTNIVLLLIDVFICLFTLIFLNNRNQLSYACDATSPLLLSPMEILKIPNFCSHSRNSNVNEDFLMFSL